MSSHLLENAREDAEALLKISADLEGRFWQTKFAKATTSHCSMASSTLRRLANVVEELDAQLEELSSQGMCRDE